MYTVECELVGKTPYSQSRMIQSPKKTGEGGDDFERRTWKERMHVDEAGTVFIPPMALKNCLADVAKYLSESVPGKGKATYTKHFEAGVMVTEPMNLGVKADDIEGEWLSVPSDGRRGGGKRVSRCFPLIRSWRVTARIVVLDETIKPEKVHQYLSYAGDFIGMGRFRPRNNGYYGRFAVENFKVL